jgi:type I restriction enzyme M protein
MHAAAGARKGGGSAPARISTPQHIAKLLVDLAAPRPADVICDPAADGCELLAAAAESIRANFPGMARDAAELEHFRTRMFYGWGADKGAMRRVVARVLRTHGVDAANLTDDDVLGCELGDRTGAYTRVLSRLPFAGRREYADTARDLLKIVRTTRPEVLLIARIVQLLAFGGRAVVIVPEALLSGATKMHQKLRSMLVESHKVEAVIALPGATFMPCVDEPTAILIFTRSGDSATEQVWFYDLVADGAPCRGASGEPVALLGSSEHEQNNVPDLLARWRALQACPAAELDRARSEQSFCVPKSEIATQGYDLSIGRYRVLAPARVESRLPHEILAELAGLEAEIFQGMKDLVGMLK